MPAIKVRENEPFDIALRRFRRLCDRAGVLLQMLGKKSILRSLRGLISAKKLLQLKEPIKKCQKIRIHR